MKLELTNPSLWKKISEKSNVSVKNRIKMYEKLGGAYKSGQTNNEQVFNKITELLKFKVNEQDHEVSMAQNSLNSIIKYAQELKQKMGEEEKEIPAWIQDHISKAENYIGQASSNYHEYNGEKNK